MFKIIFKIKVIIPIISGLFLVIIMLNGGDFDNLTLKMLAGIISIQIGLATIVGGLFVLIKELKRIRNNTKSALKNLE